MDAEDYIDYLHGELREGNATIEHLKYHLEMAIDALEGVEEFVKDIEPLAERGHTLVPALGKACDVLAVLKGQGDE